MEKIAPKQYAADWDNVGLLVGNGGEAVNNVLIALDATNAVIDEAAGKRAGLIITHHPVIFKPIKSVAQSDPLGAKIIRLIKNDIAVFSAHTNFDSAEGGTNDVLCSILGLTGVKRILADGAAMVGETGGLPVEMTAGALEEKLKILLKSKKITLHGESSAKLNKIAVCAGGGSKQEYMKEVKDLGGDCYITGDVRYHDWRYAEELGLVLIDAAHEATETPALYALAERLNGVFYEDGVKFFVSETAGML